MTLPPLVEYLLAMPNPKGGTGKLCQMGLLHTMVPAWPPGLAISYSVFPTADTYCCIEYYWKMSPQIVPGTFMMRLTHSGINIAEQVAEVIDMSEGWNVWVEITRNNPSRNTITNVSGLVQFFEHMDFYLMIQSEEDYNLVHQIVSEWRRGGPTS